MCTIIYFQTQMWKAMQSEGFVICDLIPHPGGNNHNPPSWKWWRPSSAIAARSVWSSFTKTTLWKTLQGMHGALHCGFYQWRLKWSLCRSDLLNVITPIRVVFNLLHSYTFITSQNASLGSKGLKNCSFSLLGLQVASANGTTCFLLSLFSSFTFSKVQVIRHLEQLVMQDLDYGTLRDQILWNLYFPRGVVSI